MSDHQTWDINDSIKVNISKANNAYTDKGCRAMCAKHLLSYFQKRIKGETVTDDGVDVSSMYDMLAGTLLECLGNACDDLYFDILRKQETEDI
jgi:hypothetical protein